MMRLSVVVLAAVLCAAGTAFAQAPPAPSHADWQAKHQQWEQKRMDRLAVLLDLTPAQKQQVQVIFAATRDQMKQAMKQAMEARKAARKEAETKLGQVLSPSQMKKLKLLMPHRHHGFMMRGRMGMHGHMGPGMGGWHDHGDHGPPPPPPPDGVQLQFAS